MANVHENISPELQAFIEHQPMFFVGTSPLSAAGHVNLSPKGLDTFRVLSPTRVGYLDLTGSGNETAAHLLENGRITFMFCAFDGPPKVLRLYGMGRPVMPHDMEWSEIAPAFPLFPGVRQIIVAHIMRVQTSCGFGVPLMRFEGQRDTLMKWAMQKSAQELAEYQREKNSLSIDGLKGFLGRDVALSLENEGKDEHSGR